MKEQNRLDEISERSHDWVSHDWVADDQCCADMEAFEVLINTAPTTAAGLLAWASYLDASANVEAWMIEGEAPTLIATLVEALGNLTVPA